MIRIKTYQFGLLFTGITDCISNVKCVNNNIHVIVYSIDIKTYQVTSDCDIKMVLLWQQCVCGFTLIIMFNYYLFNRH